MAEKTGGRGVDVILELVGAPHFPGNLDALALKGRIAIVGVGAGQNVDMPLMRLMQRRASIRGTVLRSRSLEDKGQAIRAFEREVVPNLVRGHLRPLIDSTFPVDQTVDAYARLEGKGKRGKVLLEFP